MPEPGGRLVPAGWVFMPSLLASAGARWGGSLARLPSPGGGGLREAVLGLMAELLGQAARNMVLQEDAILHSEDSLRKMAIITTHLQYQQEAIQKNVEQSSDLQDQLKHLLK